MRKNNSERFVKGLTCIYLIPLGFMICFNTVNSLLRTTYFDLYKDMETAMYRWDNPLIVLSGSVTFLIFFWFMSRRRRGDRICLLIGGGFSLTAVLLFRCEVTCDSEIVSDIALQFMENNYEAFSQGEYLYRYPFQLGITAILELVYRIFGIRNFVAFQMINVICVVVILRFLQMITKELFEDEGIERMAVAVFSGCLPLFLFATFIYGDMIGWCLGICSIYFVIRYLKYKASRNIIWASALLGLGVIAKSNINILVVAAVIAILLQGLQDKKWKSLLVSLLLIIISQTGNVCINNFYAGRMGKDAIPEGIPKIAWVAMSMQETDEGGYACGWYNAYNWNVYGENDFDREKTVQACMESVGESLRKFSHEQRYALNFFYKKFTSQWNAPTFQAMITNEWYSRHSEPLSGIAEFAIYGLGRDILYGTMNSYHFLIFFGTAVFFFFRRKEWNLHLAYFLLNIFGGFLFHMIWEAQSRYVMGYFILMLPLAGCGLYELILRQRKWFKLKKG